MRIQSGAMREALKEHERCELCGSKRELQAHHIIPICVGGPDVQANILVVCKKCHALLTPSSILTAFGIQRMRSQYGDEPVVSIQRKIYERCDDICESGDSLDVIEVFDIMDEEFKKFIEENVCVFKKRVKKEEHGKDD